MKREVIRVRVPRPKERAPHRPTRAYSTKKGKKGYDRKRAKKELCRELEDQELL